MKTEKAIPKIHAIKTKIHAIKTKKAIPKTHAIKTKIHAKKQKQAIPKDNAIKTAFTHLSVLPECPQDGSPPGDTVA